MKKSFIAILFVVAAQLASAQYTFFATSTDLVRKSSREAFEHVETMQVYNISLKDMILLHNVFDVEAGELSDSQIYQITEVKTEADGLIVFQARSGISGKTYEYQLSNAEGEAPSLLLVYSDEDYDLRYNGMVTALKTFKQ